MTAPSPTPGSDNPFVLGYQTRQFPYTKDGNPDVTVLDSLASPAESGLTARTAVRYQPGKGGTGATGGTGGEGASGTGGEGASGASGASGGTGGE
jgi:uncharacterized membrane protein YgcG